MRTSARAGRHVFQYQTPIPDSHAFCHQVVPASADAGVPALRDRQTIEGPRGLFVGTTGGFFPKIPALDFRVKGVWAARRKMARIIRSCLL